MAVNRPATKAQLLNGIKVARKRFEASLKGLTEPEMVKPPRPGAWSIKDILAHVSAWQDIFVRWYETGLKGGRVDKPDFRQAGVLGEINRQIYESNKHRSLKDVLAEFQSSYERILATVDSIPERDIFTRGKFNWTGKGKLVSYITANTSSHYPSHLKMIEAVKKKLGQSSQSGANVPGLVESQRKTLALFTSGAEKLEQAVSGLSEKELDCAFAPGEWTIRQIVHHVADDGDGWSFVLKKALGTPGVGFSFGEPGDFPGNEAWSKALACDKRPIQASLSLIKAHRKLIEELAVYFAGSWDNYVTYLDLEGKKQKFTAAQIIGMLAEHLMEHVTTINAIKKKHGI
jgi:hypothetical protein